MNLASGGAQQGSPQGSFGNSLLSYLQFLMLHPQGAAVPNPQPGATGGYWNARPAPVAAPPQPGIQQMNQSMTAPNYQQLIPSTGKGPSMGGGMMGGGGGGSSGGLMGGLMGGQGGSSMGSLMSLLGLFI